MERKDIDKDGFYLVGTKPIKVCACSAKVAAFEEAKAADEAGDVIAAVKEAT